ncbi:MAG: hypothetical protein B7733_14510 [Myxococcales bacterium FL481]|nr:MAG: hypothetical protein B7733_14510 [Myxococcales bacterium FL481]
MNKPNRTHTSGIAREIHWMPRLARLAVPLVAVAAAMCPGRSAAQTNVYSAGHADIAIEYDETSERFEILLDVDNGTVNGLPGVSEAFALDDIVTTTTATFERPDDAAFGGFFSPLGVGIGETVHWFPQSNQDAGALGVPFLGWRLSAASGALENDEVSVRLQQVQAPAGGSFSLWGFAGIAPVFHIASSDGIDASDELVLDVGHDHFNLGFSPSSPAGNWVLSFTVNGTRAGGQAVEQSFDLRVQTLNPAPAPATTPWTLVFLAGALILVGYWVQRRRLVA